MMMSLIRKLSTLVKIILLISRMHSLDVYMTELGILFHLYFIVPTSHRTNSLHPSFPGHVINSIRRP